MTEVYRLSELGKPSRLRDLFQTVSGIEKGSLVAVKLHMGALINYRFIRPAFVREIVAAIKDAGAKPFLTDSTTLYPRGRYNAVDYLETGGKLIEQIEIGQSIYESDYLVALTHCTGHISTGYGGALKNLGMGCITKNGKRAVHDFSVPEVDIETCERCETCINACPYSVITMEESPELNSVKCIGCLRCVKACPTGAMHNPAGWFEDYITALVEAANSIIKKFGHNLCFINFLTDITAMCDCTIQKEALVPDLGALASRDISGTGCLA
jgi:uncharacterized Fe-S center protein